MFPTMPVWFVSLPLCLGAMGRRREYSTRFFLYLWERKEILPELQQPDAYLFSAVKHRCLNFLRSQLSIVDRRQPLSDIMEQEFKLKLYSLQLLDDSQMSIDEVEQHLYRAIDKLPERCREIFVMSKLKGMKYREIAGALGISQNTVEGQMAIALKNLGRVASLSAFAASIERIRINRLCIVFASVHSIYFSQAEY